MINDEFEFINQYFANLNSGLEVQAKAMGLELGIGDDAALVKMNGTYAITTDTLIEGVHFFPHLNGSLLAARALSVNFSDVYAMGALPQFVTLSLSIPKRYLDDYDEFWQAFSDGFADCLKEHNCVLIGGNISRAPNRSSPLSITITAFGKSIEEGKSLRRDKAEVGDLIYVTGTLGANGIYVKGMYNNTMRNLDTVARQNFEAYANKYDSRIRFLMKPLIKYSKCAIDVSDGLFGDLSHILINSNRRAIVNYESLPIDRIAKGFLDDLKISQKSMLKSAVDSGGDYNLLFTIPANQREAFEEELKANDNLLGFPCTCIGEIVEGSGDYDYGNNLSTDGGLIIVVNNANEEVNLLLGSGSYNHFVNKN